MTQDAQPQAPLVPGAWCWLIQADLQPQAWVGTAGRGCVLGFPGASAQIHLLRAKSTGKKEESVHSDRMTKERSQAKGTKGPRSTRVMLSIPQQVPMGVLLE